MLLLFCIIGLVLINYRKTQQLNQTISLQKNQLEKINAEKYKNFNKAKADFDQWE